jgi:mRNA interferase MazF
VNFVDTSVKRGEIYYADLSPVVGSEQGGVRPVLIIQNDTGNRYSPTVIAAAITSQTGKARLPTHIELPVAESCGLTKDSVVLLEQVRTLDKKRLRERMGRVEEPIMEKIDTAIAVSFGLPHDRMV